MAIRILVIRPGAIGDTLLTIPLLHALKVQNRRVHITFVSNPTVLPLAQKFGLADAVFDYGALEWSELFSQFGIRTPFVQDILHHTDRVICWLRDPDNIVEKNVRAAGVTDVTVAPGRPTEASNMHVVSYLAQTIGVTLPEPNFLYSLAPGRSKNAQGVALHPGSGGASKCWPVAHFVEVIMALWQRHIPVLLLAGPADTECLSTLMQRILPLSTPSLLKLVVDAPLVEVAERLQRCKGYLGNDSGITHLAALLGLPTVVLFGPSSPALWRPIGPDVHVLYEPNLENLKVEIVLDILVKIINEPL